MNLEDKILGEKLQYYCSSSEDEESGENKTSGKSQLTVEKSLPQDTHHWSGNSANTGPKGN